MTHQLIGVGEAAPSSSAHSPKGLPAGRLKAARSKGLQPSTIAAYEADVERFIRAGGGIPCDGNSLKTLMSKLRNTHSPNTLYRLCMAVQFGHERRGYVSPTRDPSVRVWLRALQRGIVPPKDPATEIGGTRAKQKKPKSVLPLTYRMLELILDLLPKSSVERRNQSLTLLGWHTGLSRTLLVALNIGDVRFGTDALVLTIGASQGVNDLSEVDELSQPADVQRRRITIPLTNGPMCVGRALRLYIERAALDIENPTGPLFRRCDRAGQVTSDRLRPAAVALVVRQAVAKIDPANAVRYSAHSLVLGRRLALPRGVR